MFENTCGSSHVPLQTNVLALNNNVQPNQFFHPTASNQSATPPA